MKKADIKVGETYAIEAPNSSYPRPTQGTVTKVGVYGRVRGEGWHGGHESGHANYVEFTVHPDSKGSSHYYETEILPDGKIYFDRNMGRAKKPETTKVYRCPSSHVLRTWAEEEENQAASKERNEERNAAKKVQEDRMMFLRGIFDGLGIYINTRIESLGSGKIELSFDEAEKLLKKIPGVPINKT